MIKNGNFFDALAGLGHSEEFFENLDATVPGFRLERIVSRGQTSPPDGDYYEQNWTEIVIVLSGEAELEIEGENYTLKAGAWLNIPPNARHRVTKTSSETPCVWCAMHIDEPKA